MAKIKIITLAGGGSPKCFKDCAKLYCCLPVIPPWCIGASSFVSMNLPVLNRIKLFVFEIPVTEMVYPNASFSKLTDSQLMLLALCSWYHEFTGNKLSTQTCWTCRRLGEMAWPFTMLGSGICGGWPCGLDIRWCGTVFSSKFRTEQKYVSQVYFEFKRKMIGNPSRIIEFNPSNQNWQKLPFNTKKHGERNEFEKHFQNKNTGVELAGLSGLEEREISPTCWLRTLRVWDRGCDGSTAGEGFRELSSLLSRLWNKLSSPNRLVPVLEAY